MSKGIRIAVLVGALAALAGTGAQAALVKVGPLILHADGGFSSAALPKRGFAPIDFQGKFEIARKGGGVPPALQHAVVDFDRDGRIATRGLPICPAERVSTATPEQARQLCPGAIVGEGRVEGLVSLPSQEAVPVHSALTLFNGPRLPGGPTIVLHAQLTVPETQTFALVVPIERRRGTYGYRATLDVPPIAGGYGSLTRIDAKIGRRWRSGGLRRSYVSARCADGVLRTRGTFDFSDGTTIEGSVDKFCKIR
jgi:hypothetical protein